MAFNFLPKKKQIGVCSTQKICFPPPKKKETKPWKRKTAGLQKTPANTTQAPVEICTGPAPRPFVSKKMGIKSHKPSIKWAVFKKTSLVGYPPWNQHSPWKWMVGIRSFPFGKAYFQGRLLLVLGRVSKGSLLRCVDPSRRSLLCFGILELAPFHSHQRTEMDENGWMIIFL